MHYSRAHLVLRIAAVLLAAAGCTASSVLMAMSQPSKERAKPFGFEVCTPTAAVNCDYVLASRWARIGGVMPAATLGLAYFWAVGAWFLFVGPPNHRGRWWHLLPLAVTTAGLCGSLWFMYLMAFRLPVWCTWCVAAHILNAAMFLVVLLSWPWRRPRLVEGVAPEPGYPSNVRGAAVVSAVVACVLLIVMAATLAGTRTVADNLHAELLRITNNADYVDWQYRRARAQQIPTSPDDFTLGPADAPNTLVIFSDFECPFCADFFRSTDRLMQWFPGALRCIFKHYPMCSACNPHAKRTMHFFACEAASAAEAARSTGTAEQAMNYERLLYANAYRLDARPYHELAAAAGLDPTKFAAALDRGAGRDRIDEDIALGAKLGVEGTPAMFLNGRRLANWRLVKSDTDAQADPAATLTLWSKLLGVQPTSQPATTSKKSE